MLDFPKQYAETDGKYFVQVVLYSMSRKDLNEGGGMHVHTRRSLSQEMHGRIIIFHDIILCNFRQSQMPFGVSLTIT